ncbi:MAG TPA: ATP-binding protein [Devosiaceae bacterium]|nr:ATP-binding protein [Devosiaceae bacterium]
MSPSPRASITARLILTITIGVAALWLGGAAFASIFLRYELNESFDRAEAEVAGRLLPLTADALLDRDESGDEVHEVHHFEHDRDRGLVFQLRHPNGHLLLKSDDAPGVPLDRAAQSGFSDTDQYRVYTLTDPSTQLTIQVGESLLHRQRALLGATLTLLLPLLLVVPLSGLGIWLAIRRGLAPLSALRQEIALRGGSNLAPLGLGDLPVELRPIAHALDRLIGRVRAALDAERQFAANSAHELRTPIAAALAQTQRLIETTPDDRARAEARKVEATLRRLASLAEKLMQLSRADAGMAAGGEPAAVLPTVRLVLDELGAGARGRIDLRADTAAAAFLAPINVDALGIVLRNLIDNALAHSPAETPVVVEVTENSVAVRNRGPALSPELMDRIRGRFERGATGASGSGLGLAIVDTILGQVGGTLTLTSPVPGEAEGFEAVLRFPPADHPANGE